MSGVEFLVLGWAVGELLDQVVKEFRLLKNASSNMRKLRDLLERLEPSATLLRSVSNVDHPAYGWLSALHVQLQEADKLARTSTSSDDRISCLVRDVRAYRKSGNVFNHIRDLLTEASTLQWASQMALDRVLADNDAKILQEVRLVQGMEERKIQGLANLATKDDIRELWLRLEHVFLSNKPDALSVSAAAGDIIYADNRCEVPEGNVHFGGDAIADDIRTCLLKGDYNKRVGLWGMGGIGKTFTANRICCDPEIQTWFSDGIYWVTVSKERSDPYSLCQRLIEKVRDTASVSEVPKTLETAKSYLKKLLDRKRVLLILDDVWEDEDGEDVLQHFDLVSEEKKSVILVTTRDKDLLGRRLEVYKLFEIPTLSEEDSWRLFSYHAFQSECHGREVPADLRAVAKDVAKECRGLPLALEVIGSTMANRRLSTDQEALGLSLLKIWQKALADLRNASHGKNEYERLFGRLQISIDSLQEFPLKECFFFFAAYPEDYHVDVGKLVQIWVAEGLVDNDLNSPVCGEEEGKLLVACLVAKSMIQMEDVGRWPFNDSPQSCRVHDVMRDLAQHNLKFNAGTGSRIPASARDCLYAPGLNLSTFPKEWTRSAATLQVKRLSMMSNDLQEFPGPEPFHAPSLQVLMLSKNPGLVSLSERFFRGLSNLRVLDLSDTGVKAIPDGVLVALTSLVILDLTNCLELANVSNDLSELRNLKHLFLEGCQRLTELPLLEKLTKLTGLSLSLPRIRADGPHDTSNQTEDAPEQEDEEDMRAHEENDEEDAVNARAELQEFDRLPFVFPGSLRQLVLKDFSWVGDVPIKYSFDFSALSALQKLTLMDEAFYMIDVANFPALEFLEVYNSSDFVPHELEVPPLGKLAKLEYLKLPLVTVLGTESYGHEGAFPCLKALDLDCFHMPKMFAFHTGTMPKIESLQLKVGYAEQLPPSIVELHSLKRLEFYFPGTRCYLLKEDIRRLFCHEQSLPNLEYLRMVFCSRIGNLAPEEVLPRHMLHRKIEGKLTIVIQVGGRRSARTLYSVM